MPPGVVWAITLHIPCLLISKSCIMLLAHPFMHQHVRRHQPWKVKAITCVPANATLAHAAGFCHKHEQGCMTKRCEAGQVGLSCCGSWHKGMGMCTVIANVATLSTPAATWLRCVWARAFSGQAWHDENCMDSRWGSPLCCAPAPARSAPLPVEMQHITSVQPPEGSCNVAKNAHPIRCHEGASHGAHALHMQSISLMYSCCHHS